MKFVPSSKVQLDCKTPMNPDGRSRNTHVPETLGSVTMAAALARLHIIEGIRLQRPATRLEGLSLRLPEAYVALLQQVDGFLLADGLKVYGSSEVEERNQTYDVASCMPGFVAIGDDSGGRMFVMAQHWPDRAVYAVGMGVLKIQYAREVVPNLPAWLSALAAAAGENGSEEQGT